MAERKLKSGFYRKGVQFYAFNLRELKEGEKR